jgi:very-short-patch-repair endonuclease
MSSVSPASDPVFLVTAAGGAGLTRKQARGAGFLRPSQGVRVLREYADSADVLDSAALVASRDDAVLSDLTAARAWRLPLPPWIGLSTEPRARSVAVPSSEARPKRAGVHGRRLRLPADHVTTLGDIRATTPVRTWLDCAALLPFEHVVVMGDALLHRRLATMTDVGRMIAWGRRRRGIVHARLAAPLLDGAAESPGESLVRVELLVGGVRRPRCNVDILQWGVFLARADIVFEEERVIVEYDGAVHISEQERRRSAARLNRLQRAGWLVIVFTADDLKRPWAMCALVSAALRERSPQR